MAQLVQQNLGSPEPAKHGVTTRCCCCRKKMAGKIMRAIEMEKCAMEREQLISVIPGLTQWSVRERDMENPIAYFTTCGEAIKYAKAIAETKRAAVVRVLDQNGKTTSEQHFSDKTRRSA
jgi:hypothetical protein